MAAYVIMDVKVKDAAGYEEYRRAGSPSVPQYGGKYIVRGGRVDVLEGESPPNRVIVIEFADLRPSQALVQLTRVPGGPQGPPCSSRLKSAHRGRGLSHSAISLSSRREWPTLGGGE